jgi:carbonic anhydrase/acetyltransferase-like protein (isoleucine patch superfamily)
VIVERNGQLPRVDPSARIAASAAIVGNVEIGPRAYVDHSTVIESSGAPIEIGGEVIVFAGAIIRSTGGSSRPAFPVAIGTRTLVSPLCVLTGCQVGGNCYLATAAIILQGAVLGDHVRVGAGAIVHATTTLPDQARVGMRHIAVPAPEGFLSTADIERAREAVANLDFFETAFEVADTDQERLHAHVIETLLEEVLGWRDEPGAQHEHKPR